MRLIFIIILVLLIGCNQKKTNSSGHKECSKETDTIYHYWVIDNATYKFDTVFMDIHFTVNTYCLNDSSLFSTPFEKEEKGKKTIEYYVAHDYESMVRISQNGIEKEFLINMETFKDSLPEDFMKIAHLWYNQFENVDEDKIILRAKVAKPDTDYQFDFIYQIGLNGDIKIKAVEYGW